MFHVTISSVELSPNVEFGLDKFFEQEKKIIAINKSMVRINNIIYFITHNPNQLKYFLIKL
tara:strand:- start:153 stop:335 length:183 start_codon:yes stop_codon:yes gene_type:complete